MDRALEGEYRLSHSQELSLVIFIFLVTVVLGAVAMFGITRVERRLRRHLTCCLGSLERISVCARLCTVLCHVLCCNPVPPDDPSSRGFRSPATFAGHYLWLRVRLLDISFQEWVVSG